MTKAFSDATEMTEGVKTHNKLPALVSLTFVCMSTTRSLCSLDRQVRIITTGLITHTHKLKRELQLEKSYVYFDFNAYCGI